jgi:hypothetical protein
MDSPFYFFLLFPLVLGDTPRRKYIATIFDFALFLFLGRLGIFYDLHAVRSFFLFWRSRVIAVILQSTTVGAIHIATSTAVRSLPIAKGLGGPEGLTHHTTRRTDMCVCRVDTHTHPHRNKWDRYVLLFYFRSAPVRSKFEAPTEISLLKVWWLPSWKANPGWKLKWRASCSASRRAAFLLNIRFLPWIEWGGIEC